MINNENICNIPVDPVTLLEDHPMLAYSMATIAAGQDNAKDLEKFIAAGVNPADTSFKVKQRGFDGEKLLCPFFAAVINGSIDALNVCYSAPNRSKLMKIRPQSMDAFDRALIHKQSSSLRWMIEKYPKYFLGESFLEKVVKISISGLNNISSDLVKNNTKLLDEKNEFLENLIVMLTICGNECAVDYLLTQKPSLLKTKISLLKLSIKFSQLLPSNIYSASKFCSKEMCDVSRLINGIPYLSKLYGTREANLADLAVISKNYLLTKNLAQKIGTEIKDNMQILDILSSASLYSNTLEGIVNLYRSFFEKLELDDICSIEENLSTETNKKRFRL